jgi:hypothetical protein
MAKRDSADAAEHAWGQRPDAKVTHDIPRHVNNTRRVAPRENEENERRGQGATDEETEDASDEAGDG